MTGTQASWAAGQDSSASGTANSAAAGGEVNGSSCGGGGTTVWTGWPRSTLRPPARYTPRSTIRWSGRLVRYPRTSGKTAARAAAQASTPSSTRAQPGQLSSHPATWPAVPSLVFLALSAAPAVLSPLAVLTGPSPLVVLTGITWPSRRRPGG